MEHSTGNTGRLGVNAVERAFLEAGWIFREQLVEDWGIDAQAEAKENGRPTGRLVALQIKSGPSYFRKRRGSYVYYGRAEHLEYWENHCLPVFLILHDPDTGLTLWQKVERSLVTETKGGAWSIEIPPENVLDARAFRYIGEGVSSDPRSLRRRRLLLDADLIAAVDERGEAFLAIDEWVNKTLNFRGATLRFGAPDEEEGEIELDAWLPAHGVGEYVAHHFPWLDYEYVEVDDSGGSGEVEVHILEVRLNEVGSAFLTLERYYCDGAVASEPERPSPNEDTMDDEEWQELQFRRALERDWEEEAGDGR